jgi:LmbE family N-acetylglucosaminyl deacetylase/SAM-dependent methyltransferase
MDDPRIRYTHDSPGTTEQAWVEAGVGADAPPLALTGVGRLVVLAAHPDDETLGAGGLIATASGRGLPVDVVVMTAGEGSHPHSPTHDPHRLARRRRQEVVAALGELAPTARVHLLSFADGGLSARVEEMASVVESLPNWDGRPALFAAPWRLDGHPDHQAVGEAAALVARRLGARLLEYPIWFWHWGRPEPGGSAVSGVRLGLGTRERRLKAAAIAQYSSQLTPLSAQTGDEPVVGPDFRRHFERSFELFVDSDPAATGTARSMPVSYFEEMYRLEADPWHFGDRWYEQRKRDLTMAILPRPRFRSAFEPGCSIGLLTERLAERCAQLLATDVADVAVEQASRRLSDQSHVRIAKLAVPAQWPPGRFDLVVLSELGYYCDADDLALLASAARSALSEDGCLVACHWRHRVADYPLTGDTVHRVLRSSLGLATLASHHEEDFLLEVFAHPALGSVARREGLV